MYGMYVYSKWFVYASGSDHPITYARGSEWIANNKRDEKRTGFLIRRTARVKYRAYNSTVVYVYMSAETISWSGRNNGLCSIR